MTKFGLPTNHHLPPEKKKPLLCQQGQHASGFADRLVQVTATCPHCQQVQCIQLVTNRYKTRYLIYKAEIFNLQGWCIAFVACTLSIEPTCLKSSSRKNHCQQVQCAWVQLVQNNAKQTDLIYEAGIGCLEATGLKLTTLTSQHVFTCPQSEWGYFEVENYRHQKAGMMKGLGILKWKTTATKRQESE